MKHATDERSSEIKKRKRVPRRIIVERILFLAIVLGRLPTQIVVTEKGTSNEAAHTMTINQLHQQSEHGWSAAAIS